MDLTPYVDAVRRELAVAAEAGGEDARALAERLTAPLASAIRLTLLDALSAAADEITRELAPGSVEVRLRAGEAGFAVTPAATVTAPAAPSMTPPVTPTVTPTVASRVAPQMAPTVAPSPAQQAAEEPSAEDDGPMVRINLRLPEHLKARIEDAAAERGRSVNAWIVRAAATALSTQAGASAPAPAAGARSAQHFTGWVS
jgi:hypothetical protein